MKTYKYMAFIFKKLHNIFYNVSFVFRLSVLIVYSSRSCITLGLCVTYFFRFSFSLSHFSNSLVPLDISNSSNSASKGSVKAVHSLYCKLVQALRAFNLLRQYL